MPYCVTTIEENGRVVRHPIPYYQQGIRYQTNSEDSSIKSKFTDQLDDISVDNYQMPGTTSYITDKAHMIWGFLCMNGNAVLYENALSLNEMSRLIAMIVEVINEIHDTIPAENMSSSLKDCFIGLHGVAGHLCNTKPLLITTRWDLVKVNREGDALASSSVAEKQAK